MKNAITRRDFLKLAGVLPLGIAAPQFMNRIQPFTGKHNVIVVVFDALSAYDIPLYGFPRDTMPNLSRLAKRAIIYKNHYAGGNFTTPGTASILTGVLPWTHRAFQENSMVAAPFDKQNIFTVFPNYYHIAYTHNGWAYTLLKQFRNELDELIPREKLFLDSFDNFIPALFNNDDDIALVSWVRNMRVRENGFAYSLFLANLYEWYQERKIEGLKDGFPRGLPTTGSDNGFLLDQAVDFIGERLPLIPQPFVGYFHFLPPHYPYRTSLEFYNAFKGDGFSSIEKPVDVLTKKISQNLHARRTGYDEFILYCDKEFSRLYDHLEDSGLLDNTWIVLTSDHGEMFERGISGHSTDVLYEPVIRVPLVIFEPGRTDGMEVNIPTNNIDLLPTMLHVTGNEIPEWLEGIVLPPYTKSSPDTERSIFVMRANDNHQYAPLTQASTIILKDRYKLHYYFGYPVVSPQGLVKLFDVQADPEELNDLYPVKKETALELLNEIQAKLTEVNKPYL